MFLVVPSDLCGTTNIGTIRIYSRVDGGWWLMEVDDSLAVGNWSKLLLASGSQC